MRTLKYFIFLFFVIFSINLFSQELPPIQNFSPESYHAENQNWKICQSDDGNIYFSNNKGLLEFNGARWNLYPSPNGTIIRSVNFKKGKIYTGAYMEFGYWQRDSVSVLKYTSLSEKIKHRLLEDEQFWKILFSENSVLFQSLYRIYIYSIESDSFKIVDSETMLPKIFKVNESIYFQKMKQGIFEFEHGKPVLVSDFKDFKEDIVINIFPYVNKLLIQTQESGLFTFEKGQVSKWKTATTKLIDKLNVYCGIQLHDKSLLLGTIGDGLYHISKEGNLLHHINQRNGLQNNTVLSLFEDRYGNVWLGLDNGVAVLDMDSAFQVYNDVDGNLGSVYAAVCHDEIFYLGTNQGLFCKRFGEKRDFQLIEGTKGQAWMLKVIDGKVFCGHNSGTFLIRKNKATLICDLLGTWDIKEVPNNPDLLIQGNYEGLHILEKVNGSWRYRNKLSGFDMSSRYFEPLGDSEVFVNHEYKGLFRLNVSKDFKKVKDVIRQPSVKSTLKSGLIGYNEGVLYFGEYGFHTYNREKEVFEKDTLLTEMILSEDDNYTSGKLIKGVDKTLWGFTEDNIFLLSPGRLNEVSEVNKISLPASLRENLTGFESLLHLGAKKYILGTKKGYILFDFDKLEERDCNIYINTITKNRVEGEKVKIAVSKENYELSFNENNISFAYNVPNFASMSQTKYQYKLEGLYEKWSSWSEQAVASFENLPAGDYIFEVRAKVGNKISDDTAVFPFSIAKPWYRSDWILALYILIFLVLFTTMNLLYKRRYKHQKKRLEYEKEKELKLLQLENERTVIKLRNEKLRSEVEAKNKELTTSTMGIVKKNELLNIVKHELHQEKDNPYVKKALQIIDNSLSDNSDWELFQEAFDNTDRDFLKKIKAVHPSLTPNDLKLCVYLRLNLSSKEIAPLLNISPRSVEIKRYRLRKKMNLEQAQNLTDYILTL